jgi:hypothetical protein
LARQTPLPHPIGHWSGWPQLFVRVMLLHRLAQIELSGMQQVPSGLQNSPVAHWVVLLTPQLTVRLQLLVAVPHCLPVHVVDAGSGMQPQVLL